MNLSEKMKSYWSNCDLIKDFFTSVERNKHELSENQWCFHRNENKLEISRRIPGAWAVEM